MKHTVFLLTLGAISLLSACSDDKVNGIDVSNKQIRFNVTVPQASRVSTTTASIEHFRIFSFVKAKPYMTDVLANRVNNSWNTTPVMYWPADDSPVNFYCISPMVGDASKSGIPNPNIENYSNMDGTTDLLYAVTIGASTNPVGINFRHALSKLAFNFRRQAASTAQSPLKIIINEVGITDINSQASFDFPNQTTASGTSNTGNWHNQSNASDVIVYSNASATLSDNYVNLNSTGYEYAIPQSLAQSNHDLSGAYVKVLCSIYDEKSGVRIWPKGSSESAYLYFPLNSPGAANTTSSWLPGKAYAYNITIGVPVDSDKIEFDVTVDEYPSFEDMSLEL